MWSNQFLPFVKIIILKSSFRNYFINMDWKDHHLFLLNKFHQHIIIFIYFQVLSMLVESIASLLTPIDDLSSVEWLPLFPTNAQHFL